MDRKPLTYPIEDWHRDRKKLDQMFLDDLRRLFPERFPMVAELAQTVVDTLRGRDDLLPEVMGREKAQRRNRKG